MLLLKNNYIERTILFSIYSFVIIYIFKDYITYKVAYGFQVIVYLYLLWNVYSLKINKFIIPINLLILPIFFFNFQKEFIYILLICILNCIIIEKYKIKKKIFISKKNILTLFLFLFFFLKTTSTESTYFFQDIIRSIYHATYWGYKYAFQDLNQSYTAVIFASIALLFVKKMSQKNFNFYILLLIFVAFFIFGSKVAILFLLATYISSYKFFTKKFLIFLFVFLNLFVLFLGNLAIKSLPNPYIHSELYGKKMYVENYKSDLNYLTYENKIDKYYIQAKTYDEIICPSITNKYLRSLTTCNDVYLKNQKRYGTSIANIISRMSVLGYSSYYKFYSIGFTAKYILDNAKFFLLPNTLESLEKNKVINDYIISNHLAAHSLFLGTFLKFGILYGLFFLTNLFYFIYKSNDKIILSFFICTAIINLDIMVFFPLVLLHSIIKDDKFNFK